MMFQNTCILAPGLLGASMGMALKERGLSGAVTVWARRAETRVACEAEDWCDRAFETPEEAAEEADLITLCPPVEAIQPLFERIAPHIKSGALATDVGSAKSLICRHCSAAAPESAFFVGSHPMAGSEKSGMRHARADLFDGRPCFVTPLEETPPEQTERAVRLWSALGMETSTISPERHDEIVANISHLPHIAAALICLRLDKLDPNWINYAGAGFRDSTRIAAGSPPMWKAILKQNREEALRSLKAFEDELREFISALENEQFLDLQRRLEKAKAYRDRLT